MTSLRAFARDLGVSLTAVQRAIHDGRLTAFVRTPHGLKISDAEQAKQEWQANSRPWVGDNKRRDKTQSPLARVTIRERRARARIAEQEYERRKASLVPAREVDLRWAALVVGTRTKLLGIISRAKQQMPHQTPADLATWERLIREALEELSDNTEEQEQSA